MAKMVSPSAVQQRWAQEHDQSTIKKTPVPCIGVDSSCWMCVRDHSTHGIRTYHPLLLFHIMNKKSIVFTGGGTTGHVTKNLIVMEALRKAHPDLEMHYIGSSKGKEAELVTSPLATFHPIATGKLRRYFSLQTIPDFFRFLAGIWQAWHVIATLSLSKGKQSVLVPSSSLEPKCRATKGLQARAWSQQCVVFSSGGYVALPVCIAAWLRGIPIVTHETDSYPGLSNRLIGKMAKKVCLGYESAKPYFDANKAVVTGNPVSPKLFEGSREAGLKKLGFDAQKKTILFMGGSQGAEEINELVRQLLPQLVKEWQVVHITGRLVKNVRLVKLGRKKPFSLTSLPPHELHELTWPHEPSSYRPFPYLTTDYADFLTCADLIVSRAGGNSLAEIAALGKKAILIPLPLPAAAGDHQRKNAVEEVARQAVRNEASPPKAGCEMKHSEAEISEKISAEESEVPIEEMLKKMPRWRMLEKPSAEQLWKAIEDEMRQSQTTLQVGTVLPLSRGLGGEATKKILKTIEEMLGIINPNKLKS